jgi:hypothetical protein
VLTIINLDRIITIAMESAHGTFITLLNAAATIDISFDAAG